MGFPRNLWDSLGSCQDSIWTISGFIWDPIRILLGFQGSSWIMLRLIEFFSGLNWDFPGIFGILWGPVRILFGPFQDSFGILSGLTWDPFRILLLFRIVIRILYGSYQKDPYPRREATTCNRRHRMVLIQTIQLLLLRCVAIGEWGAGSGEWGAGRMRSRPASNCNSAIQIIRQQINIS